MIDAKKPAWTWKSTADRCSRRLLSRPVSHLNLTYLLRRAEVWRAQQKEPEWPWLTVDATRILGQLLRPNDIGLEFGSGRSTSWFAKRTKFLISVESDSEWFHEVQESLRTATIVNVDLRLIPVNESDPCDPNAMDYVAAAPDLKPGSLDYVLVDAMYRDRCALRATELVRPGGLLVVDNVNWFLPSASRAPSSTSDAVSDSWREFAHRVRDWRDVWTSNGVWDTAIWIRTER